MRPDALQLLLPFPHAARYDSRDFVPAASNRGALAWLDTDWPDRRLAVWGPAGCGKTHLLHVWAERAEVRIMTGHGLRTLDEVPHGGGLALDDADAVPSEPLLLHLLNTARDRGLSVLLSGQTPPSRWPIRLPDLSSRLRAIAAVGIDAPSDDLLAALLVSLLSGRQMHVPQTVQDWLLTRLPRSPAILRRAVERLDRISLETGRPVTRPLAARVLAEAGLLHTVDDDVLDAAPFFQAPGFL